MCFMGSVNNAFWLTYGLLLDDMLMFIPNVVCCFFGMMQVLLYVKYRPIVDHEVNTTEAADSEGISIRVMETKCPMRKTQESPSFRAIASPITLINELPSRGD